MGGKRRLYLLQGQAEKGVRPGPFAADLPGREQLSAGVVDRPLSGQSAIDKCSRRAADAQQRIVGVIRDLEERNEIIIMKGGKDDIIA